MAKIINTTFQLSSDKALIGVNVKTKINNLSQIYKLERKVFGSLGGRNSSWNWKFFSRIHKILQSIPGNEPSSIDELFNEAFHSNTIDLKVGDGNEMEEIQEDQQIQSDILINSSRTTALHNDGIDLKVEDEESDEMGYIHENSQNQSDILTFRSHTIALHKNSIDLKVEDEESNKMRYIQGDSQIQSDILMDCSQTTALHNNGIDLKVEAEENNEMGEIQDDSQIQSDIVTGCSQTPLEVDLFRSLTPEVVPSSLMTLPNTTKRKVLKRKSQEEFDRELIKEIKRSNDLMEKEMQDNVNLREQQMRCLLALENSANVLLKFMEKNDNNKEQKY